MTFVIKNVASLSRKLRAFILSETVAACIVAELVKFRLPYCTLYDCFSDNSSTFSAVAKTRRLHS